MDIVKTISEKILWLRRERGITQDALAAALGVTYQAVSKWENALACPDVTMLPKIAEYFGISIAELFGEEKPCAKRKATGRTTIRSMPFSSAAER